MNKRISEILMGILILSILALLVLCIIDHKRMENNEEVLFSTWGKKYAPSLEEKEIQRSSKIVEMYKTILDRILTQNNGIYSTDKYISLDVGSLRAPAQEDSNGEYVSLTANEKNELLEYCKKYHKEVKGLSIEGLKEDGLVQDNNGFISLEGALLRVLEIEKLTENKAVIWFQSFHTGLGAIMPKYELTYKNGKWKITEKEMAIS